MFIQVIITVGFFLVMTFVMQSQVHVAPKDLY